MVIHDVKATGHTCTVACITSCIGMQLGEGKRSHRNMKHASSARTASGGISFRDCTHYDRVIKVNYHESTKANISHSSAF